MIVKSNRKSCRPKFSRGFTLVELLVVISLVGILAGVTTAILNPVKQRQVAEDGVRKANLEKYAMGIEAYGNTYGKYPASIAVDVNNIPIVPSGYPALSDFVAKVPNNEPTASLVYGYFHVAATATELEVFGVWVPKTDSATGCFKYRSSWSKIKECLPVNCTNAKTADGEC